MSDRPHPPLESLFEHRGWVRAVARRLLRDEHAAEDLAQEAWVRVMRSPPDPERDPKPWLRRVLKNLAINRHRGETRRAKRETAQREERPQRSPVELVAEAEQHKRLVGLVLDLEEPFKTALVLRFYEGLGPQAISERLGIPVGTVHSRIARAMARLKQRLDDEEQGDRRKWIAAFLPLAGLKRAAPAAAAGATTTSLVGILLMTLTKPKVALLTVLLLGSLVGGGLWLAADSDGDGSTTTLVDDDTYRGPELSTRGTELTAKATAVDAPDAETSTPAQSSVALRGRVFDARHEPVKGAAVFVLPGAAPGVSRDEIRLPRFGLAMTDADGAFAMRIGEVREPRLIAWHSGYLPASVLLSEVQAEQPITLTLSDPRELKVRVQAPGGTWPVGLTVHVASAFPDAHSYSWDATRQYWWGDVEATEEELEATQVLRVATRMPLEVDVNEPKGWVAIPRHAGLKADATEHTIRLVRSAQLTVNMLDAATGAAPAAGKRMALVFERADDESMAVNRSQPVGKGSYVAKSGLAPGLHTLYLNVTGYEPYRAQVRIDHVGAHVEHTARLELRSGAKAAGRVVLRIVDGEKAPAALRRLADSRAKPGLAHSYQVLLRKQGEATWDSVIERELEDGTVSLRSDFTLAQTPGLEAGVYDLYVAKRDTGTAAFLQGVRVFADQDNEIDVRLVPGTLIRLGDLIELDVEHENIQFTSAATGVLPAVAWYPDGTWSVTEKEGVGYLLRVPVEPLVLGPFPSAEVEVTITPKAGKVQVKRVRGASEVQR